MSPWERYGIELDHLVVASASLDEGAAWLEARLGVALQAGGRHEGWGTHNRLLQLGGASYLELIAPDPGQPEPERPRPFGLDRAEVRARIAERPRLLHFVVRTGDLDAAQAALGYDPGPASAMSRGALRWRITLPADGEPAGAGLLPTLIQWEDATAGAHPARTLAPAGVALETLRIEAPAPTAALLRGLDRDPRIVVVESPAPALSARLATARGPVTLD